MAKNSLLVLLIFFLSGLARGQTSASENIVSLELDAPQLESCLRILELRAAEFDAPEAPRLSAEQALLAERGDSDDRLASTSSDLRLHIAADHPDAELVSNQELASIYLDRPPTPRAPPSEEPGAVDQAGLVEAELVAFAAAEERAVRVRRRAVIRRRVVVADVAR